MKICQKCKKTLPLTDFQNNRTKSDGKQGFCRSCFNRYIYERWKKLKLKAIEHMGGRCSKCGGVFHRAAYDFHHLDPSQKDVSWDHLKKRSWNRIVQELSKCVLLCANCHRTEHADDN